MLLELKNVDVWYGDVQVLFNVSIRVPEGGKVGIVGANAAGKTTILKTISGVVAAGR